MSKNQPTRPGLFEVKKSKLIHSIDMGDIHLHLPKFRQIDHTWRVWENNFQVTPIDLLTASDLQFLQCLQALLWGRKRCVVLFCFNLPGVVLFVLEKTTLFGSSMAYSTLFVQSDHFQPKVLQIIFGRYLLFWKSTKGYV